MQRFNPGIIDACPGVKQLFDFREHQPTREQPQRITVVTTVRDKLLEEPLFYGQYIWTEAMHRSGC